MGSAWAVGDAQERRNRLGSGSEWNWYRFGYNGSRYGVSWVRQSLLSRHFRTYSETDTEIYIPRLLHHGRTNRQHAQWNLISTSPHVIRVYRHHLLAPTRQLHSAMRRYSSCSIQVPEMRCKKLPHKNCAYYPLAQNSPIATFMFASDLLSMKPLY